MKKEFIGYTEALALKELGFDKPCLMYWNDFGKTSINRFQLLNKIDEWCQDYIEAPLYQQAFRWFREKYRLDGKPEYFLNGWYCFIINDMKGKDTSRRLFTEFPSYEEAELECLAKLIDIVKKQNLKG